LKLKITFKEQIRMIWTCDADTRREDIQNWRGTPEPDGWTQLERVLYYY
jgi:hypothetical protein